MAIKPQNQPDDDAGFEVVEHTADWALLVWGKDLDELFTFASAGMSSLMVADQDALPRNIVRSITLEAFDAETLLVDWLSELAYWAEDEQLVFREFDISITGDLLLSATVRGGRADELVKHIKAVTYHNLAIQKTGRGLQVTIVFDV
jgi:SHS2 domain-containing protein